MNGDDPINAKTLARKLDVDPDLVKNTFIRVDISLTDSTIIEKYLLAMRDSMRENIDDIDLTVAELNAARDYLETLNRNYKLFWKKNMEAMTTITHSTDGYQN